MTLPVLLISTAVMLAAACCGTARVEPRQPILVSCAEPAENEPTTTTLFGVVIDPAGRPIAGARISATQWRHDSGRGWRDHPSRLEALSSADGRYQLVLPPGSYRVEVESEGRVVVWVAFKASVGLTRVLDHVIDRSKPPGVVAVHDARFHRRYAVVSACEWTCPPDRPPIDEWWARDTPCPPGTNLRTRLEPKNDMSEVACTLPSGQRHGAYTSWSISTSTGEWVEYSGWFERGQRCGTWREPPPPLPVKDEPTS